MLVIWAIVVILINQNFGRNGIQTLDVITSGILSTALVILYFRQNQIMEYQKKVESRNHETNIEWEIIDANDDNIYFEVTNDGIGYAENIGFITTHELYENYNSSMESGTESKKYKDGKRSSKSVLEPGESAKFESKVRVWTYEVDNGGGSGRAEPFSSAIKTFRSQDISGYVVLRFHYSDAGGEHTVILAEANVGENDTVRELVESRIDSSS